MKTLGHNLKQLLICLDQLANVIFSSLFSPGERSWADETLSAHAWRLYISGKTSIPCKLIDALALLFGDAHHCQDSYESERIGRQLPPELRKG